jgi:hypothetical protein
MLFLPMSFWTGERQPIGVAASTSFLHQQFMREGCRTKVVKPRQVFGDHVEFNQIFAGLARRLKFNFERLGVAGRYVSTDSLIGSDHLEGQDERG